LENVYFWKMNERLQKVLFHLAGWLIFFLNENWADFIGQDSDVFGKFPYDGHEIGLTVSSILVPVAIFYLFYGLIWKKLVPFRSNKWVIIPLTLAAVFFGGCAYTFLRYLVEETLYPVLFGFGNYRDPSFPFYYFDNYFRAHFPIAASAMVFLIERNSKREKESLQLLKEKSEAELSYLRAQLNPHFLFNSLNILYTQAFQLDEKLASTILKFSDVLRHSLKKSTADQSTIQEEIQLARNYIDIFKERFEERCFVQMQVAGDDLNHSIEPLLIISFLENAFKHGTFSDPNYPIQFRWEIKNGQFAFCSQNRIKKGIKDKGAGIGLENVRKRLQLLYPDRHELHIENDGHIFKLELKLRL
jgi:two-component system, LytTR family, sensor kinase